MPAYTQEHVHAYGTHTPIWVDQRAADVLVMDENYCCCFYVRLAII